MVSVFILIMKWVSTVSVLRRPFSMTHGFSYDFDFQMGFYDCDFYFDIDFESLYFGFKWFLASLHRHGLNGFL